jgi:hypothetical protein
MEFLLLLADISHLAAEKQVRRDGPRQISRQSAWKFFDNTLQGASKTLLKASAVCKYPITDEITCSYIK